MRSACGSKTTRFLLKMLKNNRNIPKSFKKVAKDSDYEYQTIRHCGD
jgi:hypothetical protein